MKTTFISTAIIAVALVFTGCSNDDDDLNIGKEKEIETAFKQKYPEAQKVSWEKKGNYVAADFWRTDLKAEAEAWFDSNATWLLTETDIVYEALPQLVKDAFASSEYADWRIDDVDVIDRPETEPIYIIEIEKNKEEFLIFFSPNGNVLKTMPDVNDDVYKEQLILTT